MTQSTFTAGDSDDRRRSRHSHAGRIGALRQQATHDTRETTAAARAAFLARFEPDDPDGSLTEAERERRTRAARREYFARMAYASAKSRGAKARKSSS